MTQVNLMIRTKNDKLFLSQGDHQLSSVPRKGDYFTRFETIYIVEFVSFDESGSADIFLLETDIESLAIVK
jgi:hypothetical protein